MSYPTATATATATTSPPQDIVPVDDEPLHVERWKSDDVRLVDVQFPPHTTSLWHQHVHYGVYIALTPLHAVEQSTEDAEPKQLTKQRGDVFCRDHTKDRLTHVVTTGDDAMRIIEVELVRDQRRIAADAPLPLHVHRSVVLVHEDARCRVYELTLTRSVDEVSLVLPTNSVLVAICDAAVSVWNPSADDDTHADHAHGLPGNEHKLEAGDDLQLVPGQFRLKGLEYDDARVASFILTEVF